MSEFRPVRIREFGNGVPWKVRNVSYLDLESLADGGQLAAHVGVGVDRDSSDGAEVFPLGDEVSSRVSFSKLEVDGACVDADEY